MSRIAGLLLAAGRGRRFGGDKRWHRLDDGRPMLLAAAQNLVAACPQALVVLRTDDGEWAALLQAEGIESVGCADADLGMGRSLACGVAHARDASGWLVALADMPWIAPTSYRAVLAALAAGAPLARPDHAGRSGHPVGFAAAYADRLIALSGDEGGRSILAADADIIVHCPVDDPGVLADVDRPTTIS